MVSVDLLDSYFWGEMEYEAIHNGEKPSLTELPDLVLRMVTKELDFQSVKNFRATCSRFLHLTPNSFERLTAIQIKVDYKEIAVYFLSDDKIQKTLRFRTCRIWEPTTWEHMLSADWDFIFRQRETPLKFFSIEFERYNRHPDVSFLYKIFKQILKNRPAMSAEIIYLDVSNHEDVLSILPFFDASTLKSINLSAGAGDLKKEFNMEKLYGLDQWKKSEELEIWSLAERDANVGLTPFSHFSYFSIASSQVLKTWGVKKRKNCFKPIGQREEAERAEWYERLREQGFPYPDRNEMEY